jgi:hypothetical protein
LTWLFGSAAFLSALLLFSIQPMIGKMVLPIMGGTPGAWNTCMLFFQGSLLAGYACASLGGTMLTLRRQCVIQSALLCSVLLFLPILIPVDLREPVLDGPGPAIWLFKVLIVSAGFPLIVLGTMTPTLQRWFSQGGNRSDRDPYVLYAISNAGSLLGLLSYPWIVEPCLSLSQQSRVWATGAAALAVLVPACGALAFRYGATHGEIRNQYAHGNGCSPSAGQVARWIVPAFVTSSWLLGLTAYISTDLAPIPLIWVIPLAIYLLTYIIAFAPGSGIWVRAAAALLPLLVVPLVMVLSAGFTHLCWMPLHLLAFCAGALVCHGKLAAQRPAPEHATAFYLAIALGGVLGGVFNSLVAPLVFDRLVEYPLVVVLACLVAPGGITPIEGQSPSDRLLDVLLPLIVFGLLAVLVAGPNEILESTPGMLAVILTCGMGTYACATGLRRPVRFALTAGGLLLASGLAREPGGSVIDRERGFFGALKVLHDSRTNAHRLLHGSTLHGQQSLDPELSHEPSTYYAQSGPIGQVFDALEPELQASPGARVAIVGLGTGTLASYAKPGQCWTFYELDPTVVRIADDTRLFTYLAACRTRGVAIEIIPGDARQRLCPAADHSYRLIVLDVFSSDTIPAHMLTLEAFRLYRSKLVEGGLLVFHLSNRYFDFDPVIRMQADAADMASRIQYDLDLTEEEKRVGKLPSIWAVLARSEAELGTLIGDRRWQLPRRSPRIKPWTDDFSNPASFLVWSGRRNAALVKNAAQRSSSLILRTKSVVLSPSSRGQMATLPP